MQSTLLTPMSSSSSSTTTPSITVSRPNCRPNCRPLLVPYSLVTRPPRPFLFTVKASSSSPPSIAVDSPPAPTPAHKLNKYSSRVTEPKSQGASQAVLLGVGLSEDDLSKPQVGISSVWYEGNTCNMHLLRLSEAVREGVVDAGMVGFRFNTIGVSDAISMGTRGMCYSLQSRDLIADSIETVMSAQWYDANISIPGCDKNVNFSCFTSLSLSVGLFVVCAWPNVSSLTPKKNAS